MSLLLTNCTAWPGLTVLLSALGGDGGGSPMLFLPGSSKSSPVPTSVSVSSANSNGAYKAGSSLNISVTFPNSVTVSGGTPSLNLNNGASASYQSGSGSKVLFFLYTVGSGEDVAKLDVLDQSSFVLNGASVLSSGGSTQSTTLPAPGASGSLSINKSLEIDTIAPTVSSTGSPSATNTYGPGSNLQVNVTFSETVTISGTPYIDLNIGRSINFSSLQSGVTLTFPFTVSNPDDTSALDYVDSSSLHLGAGGSILDKAGNAAVLSLVSPGVSGSVSASKTITIDTVSPSITNVTATTANGTYGIGAAISIQVVFDEPVNVTGTPNLVLETGSVDNSATYVSGSGSSTLVFQYTVTSGDTNGDLDYVASTSLSSGTIQDLVGNSAVLTLPNPGASGSLAANKALVIDTSAATISFSASALSVDEDDGTGSATVSISSAVPGSITVDYAVTSGTATGSGTDYTLASGTVTITNPATSDTINFSINNDSLDEPTESFTITLSNPSGVVLGSTTAVTVSILDDDNSPEVEVCRNFG
ncbi:Calx-beta domain-containing protein [Leptospira sp. SA-E8]|uniref:Calx-beta domain-containing protein n=1 Tax=Leptospira sp. SA-E8 TaxID=3422259 RepID=UPI003EBD2E3E